MKRNIKIVLLLIGLIVFLAATCYLYLNDMLTYAIVSGAFSIVFAFCLIGYITNTRSEEAIYKSNLKKTLNCYDAILVQSHNFPELKGKNIIKVANLEDLVDAQLEIRKPIYYMIEGEDSCSFVLLDSNEACVYVMKQNEDVVSPLELIIAEYEKNNDVDTSLLEDIEKTTIIKLNNSKSFKVSPYRKEADDEKEEIKSNQAEEVQKQDIEKTRSQKKKEEKSSAKLKEDIETL